MKVVVPVRQRTNSRRAQVVAKALVAIDLAAAFDSTD
jgi:hypothetical protein